MQRWLPGVLLPHRPLTHQVISRRQPCFAPSHANTHMSQSTCHVTCCGSVRATLAIGAASLNLQSGTQVHQPHRAVCGLPPGELCPGGPRHDNDHLHFRRISITPTQQQVLCTKAPFLPSNRWVGRLPALGQQWRKPTLMAPDGCA